MLETENQKFKGVNTELETAKIHFNIESMKFQNQIKSLNLDLQNQKE